MENPIMGIPTTGPSDKSEQPAPSAQGWSPEPRRSWALASDTPGLYLPPADIEPVIPLPPVDVEPVVPLPPSRLPDSPSADVDAVAEAPGLPEPVAPSSAEDAPDSLPAVLAGLAALRGPGSIPETFVIPEPIAPPAAPAAPPPAPADRLPEPSTLPVVPTPAPDPSLPPAAVAPPPPFARPRGAHVGNSPAPRGTMVEDALTAKLRETADPDLVAALSAVVTEGASDLHVVADAPPMLRVDGGLRPVPGTEVWDDERTSSALRSLLTEAQEQRFDEEFELDFAVALSADSRFRVNFAIQRGSVAAAFRLIPTRITPLAELGVPDVVGEFAKLPRGLVLVTGPTGSGKSTTLAALIDLVNRTRNDHIVTVEDPIEYMHQNKKALITQREVGEDTHSFAQALKHVLRQDPDVILIGEMRDLETVSVALTAAETGHLVFATLHTQDAGSTIDRVIDVFPPHQQAQVRTQLAGTLQGVVCQTLIKRASGTGRAVATEVMFATPAIANLIREGKTYQVASALQSGAQQGMQTMDQSLAELVNTGTITRGAAIEKAQDVVTLERMIKRTDLNHDSMMRTAI